MLIGLELAFNFTQHYWNKYWLPSVEKVKYLCGALQTKFNFHNNKTFLYSLTTSTSPLSLSPAQVKLALWVLSMTIIFRNYVTSKGFFQEQLQDLQHLEEITGT